MFKFLVLFFNLFNDLLNNFIKIKNFKLKKGIISLEALIGTIISIIALILVFQIFSSVFLNSSTNLKIVKSNVKSIDNFINLGNNNVELSTYTDCFIGLRLFNLENFQFENDKNYGIVIDNKGIYIISLKQFKNLISNNFQNFNLKPYIKFKKNINICYDNTESPSFSKSIIPFSDEILGEVNNNIELNCNLNNKIILLPNFDNFNIDYNMNNMVSINKYQNKYIIKFFNSVDNKIIDLENNENHNLIYDRSNNNLFVSKDFYSNILFKNNLCIRKNLININVNNYYNKMMKEDPLKLDFINYKIDFYCKIGDNNYINGNYYWKSEVVCEDLDKNYKLCKDISKNDDYKSFFEKLKNNCFSINIKNGENINFGVKEIKELKKSELKKVENIEFDDLFSTFSFKTENRKLNTLSVLTKNGEINKNFYEDHVFDNTEWKSFFSNYFNDKINGCNEDYCNKIIVLNGDVYFYNYKNDYDKIRVQSSIFSTTLKHINYYKFNNYDILRLKNNKLYFNTEEIKYKKSRKLSKEDGKWFSSDTNYFYFFNINLNGRKIDVILSQSQFDNIRGFNEK